MDLSSRLSLVSGSEAETRRLGALLGGLLQPGDVVALLGQLGAGKTTFCVGLASGLGCTAPVSSPTYLLCHEYPGPIPLLHLDGYFAERLQSLLLEGLVERLHGAVVVVVEWAEQVSEWLPADHLEIELTSEGPESRRLELAARGPSAAARLAALRAAVAAAAPRSGRPGVPTEEG